MGHHLRALSFAEATATARVQQYNQLLKNIVLLLEGETDLIAALATVVCELHGGFEHFHWTGFYRVVPEVPNTLIIGPYQGTHGCLRIPFSRGVCGAAATTRATLLVDDVEKFPGHIACSSSTRSEIVVPLLTSAGQLLGVLDVDSNYEAAFTEQDKDGLEEVCKLLGEKFSSV
eukprot:jgi/Botrbrau1/8027/Bobra.13_2s0004.2